MYTIEEKLRKEMGKETTTSCNKQEEKSSSRKIQETSYPLGYDPYAKSPRSLLSLAWRQFIASKIRL